ncbi:MAG: tetratricopeptide repeat protein [Candidatus Omnitrophica bacterium]|nr:tetratricopeptide repeat protein [Candidatus Omnitrophota bacterium]
MRKSTRTMFILQVVIIPGIFCSFSFAEDGSGIVSRANNLYRQKKYDEAIKLYNQAQIKSPDSPEINYNIGTAQYKKGEYASAVGFFEKATFSKDKALESKANFNIANSKYKLGKVKENTELEETVSLLRQSLDYYKRAIDLNPADRDPKINHELVERELKMLLDKLKQEQDKQDKQKEESGQQDKNSQQSQQSQQEQEDSVRGQKAEEREAGEQKVEEQEKEAAQEADQAEDREEDGGQRESAGHALEETKEMSQEEANMLLEGYRQEENSSGKLEDTRKGAVGRVLKDW